MFGHEMIPAFLIDPGVLHLNHGSYGALPRVVADEQTRLRAMAEEYERLSGGKITTEFVDPKRDSDRALEIADEYDITFVEEIVIIDAIPVLSPDMAEGADANERAKKLEELRRTHLQFVRLEDMLVYGLDSRRERRVAGYQDEDQLVMVGRSGNGRGYHDRRAMISAHGVEGDDDTHRQCT